MRYKKQYGENKVVSCPFCGAAAYSKNADGLPVCANHKHKTIGDVQCLCGEWLEQKSSKWGIFYVCSNCGPQNLNRVLANNPDATKASKETKQAPKVDTMKTTRPAMNNTPGAGVDFIHPCDPRFLPK